MDITTLLYIVAVVGYSLYSAYAKKKAKQQGKQPPVQEAENTELPEWMKEIFGEMPESKPRPAPQPKPVEVSTPKKVVAETKTLVSEPQRTTSTVKQKAPASDTVIQHIDSQEKIFEEAYSLEKNTQLVQKSAISDKITSESIEERAERTWSLDLQDPEEIRKAVLYAEILKRRY